MRSALTYSENLIPILSLRLRPFIVFPIATVISKNFLKVSNSVVSEANPFGVLQNAQALSENFAMSEGFTLCIGTNEEAPQFRHPNSMAIMSWGSMVHFFSKVIFAFPFSVALVDHRSRFPILASEMLIR